MAQLTGVAVTLYTNDGLRVALDGARPLLLAARPDVVQLHTFPSGGAGAKRIADEVRALLPGTRIWLGIGADYHLRQYRKGVAGYSARRVVRELVRCADAAAAMGAEAIVWDPEAAWKGATAVEQSENNALAREIVTTVAREHPALVQAHTTYDHPTYHSGYAWRGWIGPGSPVVLALPQVYAAPGGDDVHAHRGALPRREAGALASWGLAVRKGWIKPDVEPDTLDDLDWRPYVQCHSVACADTVALGLKYDTSAYWAVPSRVDIAGRCALLAICELRRLGFRDVAAFQRSAGLTADGVCGPRTLAALGIPTDPARPLGWGEP